MHQWIRIVALGFLASTLLQCGKHGRSQKVKITVTPGQPRVFNVNGAYSNNGTVVEVPAPYFSASMAINNESDTPITIVGVRFEVTSTDAQGTPSTKKVSFNAASLSYSIPATGGGVTTTCNYDDFGQFDPGGSALDLRKYNDGPLFAEPNSSSTAGCPTKGATFYVGGLTPGLSPNSFSYSVKVEPIGFFGARGNPEDRFYGFSTIYAH